MQLCVKMSYSGTFKQTIHIMVLYLVTNRCCIFEYMIEHVANAAFNFIRSFSNRVSISDG